MNVCVFCRRLDLLRGNVAKIVSVRDIVSNATVEENGFLTDETQMTTKMLQIPLANVLAISKLKTMVYKDFIT